MSSKWGPATASSIISDVLRQEQEHEDTMYASLSLSYILLNESQEYQLTPIWRVLPVLTADKDPAKFEDLINRLKEKVSGLKVAKPICEPQSNKTRGRYIFQQLLKICSKDILLLYGVAQVLETTTEVLITYSQLSDLDNYSLLFNRKVSSIVTMALSLSVEKFVVLAKSLMKSESFRNKLNEDKELRISYILWLFNLLDYPAVSINIINSLLLRVYYPERKVRFKINSAESSVIMQPDDGILPDQAANISLDELESGLVGEAQSSDTEDDTSWFSYESLMESRSWVYALGLGVGVGGALLPFLGLDLLLGSAVGGATGLGVTHFWNSSSEEEVVSDVEEEVSLVNAEQIQSEEASILSMV